MRGEGWGFIVIAARGAGPDVVPPWHCWIPRANPGACPTENIGRGAGQKSLEGQVRLGGKGKSEFGWPSWAIPPTPTITHHTKH